MKLGGEAGGTATGRGEEMIGGTERDIMSTDGMSTEEEEEVLIMEAGRVLSMEEGSSPMGKETEEWPGRALRKSTETDVDIFLRSQFAGSIFCTAGDLPAERARGEATDLSVS